MTREERNTRLKNLITCLKCEVSGKECDDNCPIQYEAGNMGEIIENLEVISKVLEQEPTTKDDLGVDAVNRKELLKIYEDRFLELQKLKHLKDNKGVEDRQMGVNYCINILREMPSINPQPKTGRWIFDKTLDEHYYCSECKSMGVDYWDYCPNCGAKMVEPQESEEA